MARADDFATIADNLTTALKNMTAQWVAQGMPVSYTDPTGQSVDWNSFRQNMIDQIREANELAIAAGGSEDSGLYEERLRGYT